MRRQAYALRCSRAAVRMALELRTSSPWIKSDMSVKWASAVICRSSRGTEVRLLFAFCYTGLTVFQAIKH